MKTVVLGDIHGRSIWKPILEKESDADTVVFIGDYFDSFDIPGLEQLQNFEEIIKYKEESGKEVVMLVGNHDHHYFPEIGYTGTSGFQSKMYTSISNSINYYRKHLQMCYAQGEYLFSHAGISVSWLKNVFKKDWTVDNVVEKVNELFLHKPRWFNFSGLDPYGDDTYQTPIWIRPRSLKIANNNTKLYKKYIQVVGHTHQNGIQFKGRTYFVDTFDTSNDYLTIVDGKVTLASLNFPGFPFENNE